ncbi:MAG: hypothetical protein Q8P00_04670 [Dehalococcoidia bacterium]|nr:hypothetical protein [Dehalococcoidia bacterium]
MSSDNINNKRYMLLGLAWAILGVAGIGETALTVWRVWSTIPGAFPRSLIAFLPAAISRLAVLLAGVGIMAHKKWGWVLAVVMSAVLLLYSAAALSVPFFYARFEGAGIGTAVRAAILTAYWVPLSLCTLIWFFRDRRAARDQR